MSCSNNLDKRLALIERELNIDLPETFEVIQDDDITISVVPSEYDLILTLKFDEGGFVKLEEQIRKTPYFNQTWHFDNSNNEEVKDSLSRSTFRGTWHETESGFDFDDFFGPETSQLIKGGINVEEKTLKFTFQQI